MIYWQDMKRFIRAISRIHLDSDQERYFLQFLNHRDVPWEQLLLLAQSEGVDGLFYHHLCRVDGLSIPERYRVLLREMHAGYQRNRTRIIEAAQTISEHLQQNKLSTVAIQGLSLIRIYNHAGIRPMGDMDILVKPEERDFVVELLQNIGYQIPNPAYPNNLFRNGLWLDVHTHILNLDRIGSRRYVFPMDLSVIWNRALPMFDDSTGILAPNPVDNFVFLSLHALKHSYSRTIWLVDLYELLQDIVYRTNGWNKVIERSRYWRQERIVTYGLRVLEEILGMTIPERIRQSFNFYQLGSMEKYLLRLKIRGFNRPEYYIALWCLSIKGIRNRIEFLRETVFPRKDIMEQIYLKSSTRSRISRWIGRLIQSVILLGSNVKQAFSNR